MESRWSVKTHYPAEKLRCALWKDGVILHHRLAIEDLLLADSAMISITHTKNGTKVAVVHHDAIGGAICPVATLARRISNLHGMAPTCALSSVCHGGARETRVLDRCITVVVRWGATSDFLVHRSASGTASYL